MRSPALSKFSQTVASIFLATAMVVYLPSLFVYWVHPGQWWVMGVLAIGFPFTWLAFALAVVIGFTKSKRYGTLLLLLWLAGLPIMKNVVGLHRARPFVVEKQAGTLRILQWNCMHLPGNEITIAKSKSDRQQAVQWLKQYNPDILLLQDFTDNKSKYSYSNLSLLQDSLGYQFVCFKPFYVDSSAGAKVQEGVAIFSKLPWSQWGSVSYTRRQHPAYIAWVDVLFQQKLLRLATTHFTSMNLNTKKVGRDSLNYVQLQDSTVLESGDIWKKLRYYQPYHVLQANTLRSFLDTSSLPTVLGLDMNSVPSSYVYNRVKGNYQDAFLHTGFGFGRSYQTRLPHLRIDYLLVPNSLQIVQMMQQPLPISDHQLLLADVKWK